MKTNRLFAPGKLAGLEIKNKIAMPALHLGLAIDGAPSSATLDFYEARAAGGAGIITVGVCNTWPQNAHGLKGALELSRDNQVDPMATLANKIKQHGAIAGVQLAPLIGYADPSWTPELSLLPDILASVAAAAKRAQKAGFDFIELMLNGGSIFSLFLSKVQNHWELPGYSNDQKGRLRLSIEAVKSITSHCTLPVVTRIHGHEYLLGGYGMEGGIVTAKAMISAGAKGINVTGAGHRTTLPQLTGQTPPAAFAYLARNIADAVSVPVFFGGRIRTPAEALRAMSNSKADFINMGRALIADPMWPQKAMEAESNDIVACMACGTCFDQVFSKTPIRCSLNPEVGRTKLKYTQKISKKLNIMVVGSGPAGLEAAWSYCNAGHRVQIMERDKQPGGKWRHIAALNGREDLAAPLNAFIRRLLSNGVEVKTNTEATPAIVRKQAPDVLVLAMGAVPVYPDLPGIKKHPNVLHANEVLLNPELTGDNVAIIGAGGSGVELAIHLACEGLSSLSTLGFLARYGKQEWLNEALAFKTTRKITLLKRRGYPGKGLGRSTRWTMIQDLKRLGVRIIDNTKYKNITQYGINIYNLKTEQDEFIKADTIIMATGYKPNNALLEEFANTAPTIIPAGDITKVSDIGAAISSGRNSL